MNAASDLAPKPNDSTTKTMTENTTTPTEPTRAEAFRSTDLLASLADDLAKAKWRRLQLIRDSQDARLKAEVIEEYIMQTENLLDKHLPANS